MPPAGRNYYPTGSSSIPSYPSVTTAPMRFIRSLYGSSTRMRPTLWKTFYYALRRPKFSLYLGRRSCPAGLPLYPRMMPECHVETGIRQLSALDKAEPWLKKLAASGLIRYVWEQGGLKTEEAGMELKHEVSAQGQGSSAVTAGSLPIGIEYYHAESVSGEP